MPDCPTAVPEQAMNAANQFYEVQIVHVANGFVCRIGCKTFVAKTWEELSKGLAKYWKNPSAARKEYCKGE